MASLIRRPKGYSIKFSLNGRQIMRSIGTEDEETAKRHKALIESRLHALRSGLIALPPNMPPLQFVLHGQVDEHQMFASVSLEDAINDYLTTYAVPRKFTSTVRTELVHFAHLMAHFGRTTSVSRISAQDMESYVNRRRETVTAATVNKEMATLKQFFAFCLNKKIISENPVHALRRFKEAGGNGHHFMTHEEIQAKLDGETDPRKRRALMRFRYLSEDEIGELIKLVHGTEIELLVTCLSYTGARIGELLKLKWGDIDWPSGRLWLRSRKQSQSEEIVERGIEIHPQLFLLLEERRAENDVLVFGEDSLCRQQYFRRAFNQVVSGTRFEGIGFHCFRHSFSSNLSKIGVAPDVIDNLMGHHTISMRRRYMHLFPETKRSAIGKLNFEEKE